jgi:hypothetical protein
MTAPEQREWDNVYTTRMNDFNPYGGTPTQAQITMASIEANEAVERMRARTKIKLRWE